MKQKAYRSYIKHLLEEGEKIDFRHITQGLDLTLTTNREFLVDLKEGGYSGYITNFPLEEVDRWLIQRLLRNEESLELARWYSLSFSEAQGQCSDTYVWRLLDAIKRGVEIYFASNPQKRNVVQCFLDHIMVGGTLKQFGDWEKNVQYKGIYSETVRLMKAYNSRYARPQK
jgi:hypothetical protein